MKETILIVEDLFVEADYLRILLERSGYRVTGIARSVTQARELIQKERPGFVLLDIFLKGKHTGIDLARELAEEHIPFVFLSANSNEEVLAAAKTTQPYGFLVKPFRERELLITLEIARYRHEHSEDHKQKQASELGDKLGALMREMLPPKEKLLRLARIVQVHCPFDCLSIDFEGAAGIVGGISFLRIGFDEYQVIAAAELKTIAGSDPASVSLTDVFQLQSEVGVELGAAALSFCLYSRRADLYQPDHEVLLEAVTPVLAEVVGPALAALSLEQGVKRSSPVVERPAKIEPVDGIIGKSHLLLNVLDHISQVAPSDTSVLILGESGTGKERIADRIHRLSNRAASPFVKVNCAALPVNLIESELFGHEKGAFTGAFERKIGKFERAHKGTIFLDEIGEMPLELQVKFLRVLQEREIERVGGLSSIPVDVRILAATNKNLEKEVAEGRFRLDLYYRLNVFPLTLPALRHRRDDIPLLVEHFLTIYNRKTGKHVVGLTDKVMQRLMDYDWPGNIRELEHLIERSVLLSKGTIIEDVLLPEFQSKHVAVETARPKTIHENERDYILSVLRKCNGKIWGPGAAAEILNLPPSTLKSKMKKLGIKKEYTE